MIITCYLKYEVINGPFGPSLDLLELMLNNFENSLDQYCIGQFSFLCTVVASQ